MKPAQKSKFYGTLSEYAAGIGENLKTLGGWIRRSDFPYTKKAPFPKSEGPQTLRWAANALTKGRPPAKGPTKDLREEKLRQEIRKLRAHADQAETALAKERGSLLDAAEVEREWASVGVVVRNSAENLPSQILPLALTHGMPQEAAGKFQGQVEELIAGMLRHLSGNVTAAA